MKKISTLSLFLLAMASSGMAQDTSKEAPTTTKESTASVESTDNNNIMAPSESAVALFDGKSLTNWKPAKGDEKFWSVKDGILNGGDLEKAVPRNVWLLSDKSYENFELTFAIKFTDGGGPGLKNSGVQVRSLQMGKSVCGYQIDAGPTHPKRLVNEGLGYWGNIWDEHRRGPLVTAINQDKLLKSVQQFDGWNTYKTVCDGPNIKTWINGILAHDYTEKEVKIIAADGIIALQAHSGGKFLVHFKDIKLKELPATEGSTKWTDEGVLKGRPKKAKKPKNPKKAKSPKK